MFAPIVPRFRTRLSAAFVLVAGVTSGLLALGSFLTIKEYRYRTFSGHAEDVARLGLLSAPGEPSEVSLAGFESLLDEFRARAGFETVARIGDLVYSSSSELGASDIPASLRPLPEPGELAQTTVTVRGTPYLVVGGAPLGGTSELFFFFHRSDLVESLRQFGNVLAVGWLASVAFAALVGQVVARRTLRPVARAAEAAQSLADGLLETRLPAPADDEFGAWAQSFNRMAGALEEKIQALSAAAARERRFTADVAHELRTPLTGMSSAASLLGEELESLPKMGRRPAELLIDDVRRLEGLVLELLELARIDAGQDDVQCEALSVPEAVRAVLSPWGGEGRVRATVPDGLMVVADRARFKRVVSNLVANALDHGGGHAEVIGRAENGTVALDVLDRGPGLSEEDIGRVFERFYKADSARARGGSGLGLAIALEQARAQGGSIEAANREGGGARFTFRLAAAPPPEAPGAPDPADHPWHRSGGAPPPPGRFDRGAKGDTSVVSRLGTSSGRRPPRDRSGG